MIAIINRGPHTGDSGGERNYDVCINDELITQFKHKRSDGLGSLPENCKLISPER
jgi:hypothetical protein